MEEKEKNGNMLNDIAEKGKQFTKIVAEKAQDAVDYAQQKSHDLQLKKYNPIFPDDYNSLDFHLPNVIEIVDDAVRKDVEVCKGAIGWNSTEKGIEVFHLYDEAVAFSGLHFIPAASCNNVYLVDSQSRDRFISVDVYVSKLHDSRIAELEKIAFSIGAKECTIKMIDSSKETVEKKGKKEFSGKGEVPKLNKDASASLAVEKESDSAKLTNRESDRHFSFPGNTSNQMPELRWYKDDEGLVNFINVCLADGGKNKPERYQINLYGKESQCMSEQTAVKIDAALDKLGYKAQVSLKTKITTENEHILSFELIF